MAGLVGVYRPEGLTREDCAAIDTAARGLDYSGASVVDRWRNDSLCVARVRHAFEPPLPLAMQAGNGTTFVAYGRVHDRAGGSDDTPAAVAAAAFDRAGVAGCADLNGQFNLVVHDAGARTLFLVNDRLASHPLFYRAEPGRLLFSSQTRVVRELMSGPARLDLSSLRQFVVFQTILGEGTLIQGVRTLPPAAALRYADVAVTVSRYWSLRYEEDRGGSEREHADRLADVLHRVITRGVGRGEGAAVLLSGGLDSRALVAIAPPMPAVTLGDWENDEVGIARAIARSRELPFTFLRRPRDFYPDLVDLGCAIGDGAYRFDNAHFARLREALPASVTSLLSGYGFDLLLKGETVPSRRLSVRGARLDRHAVLEIPHGVGRDALIDLVLDTMGGSQWRHPATRRLLTATPAPTLEEEIRAIVGDLLDRARDAAPTPQQCCEYVRMQMMATRFPAYLNVLGIRHYFRDLTISLDNEILDQHLAIPPRLRLDGRAYRRALARLAPDTFRIPDANTGFAPGTHPLVEHALGRLRRLSARVGLAQRTPPPDPAFTHGSWPNMGELIRRRPALLSRIADTIGDDAAVPGDVFDVQYLKRLLADHVERRVDATWPLLLVLTAGTWHRANVAGLAARR